MPNIDITALRALEQRELSLDRAIAICKVFPRMLDEVERLLDANERLSESLELVRAVADNGKQTEEIKQGFIVLRGGKY